MKALHTEAIKADGVLGSAGVPLARPEPLYFWVYFVFMNVIWIVVPSIIILVSGRRIGRAVREADRCAACHGAGTCQCAPFSMGLRRVHSTYPKGCGAGLMQCQASG